MTIICYKINRSLQEPNRGSGNSICRGGKDPEESIWWGAWQSSRSYWAEGKGGFNMHRGKSKTMCGGKFFLVLPDVQIREWQTMAFGPNPACCPFLYVCNLLTIKFTCLKHTSQRFSVYFYRLVQLPPQSNFRTFLALPNLVPISSHSPFPMLPPLP